MRSLPTGRSATKAAAAVVSVPEGVDALTRVICQPPALALYAWDVHAWGMDSCLLRTLSTYP